MVNGLVFHSFAVEYYRTPTIYFLHLCIPACTSLGNGGEHVGGDELMRSEAGHGDRGEPLKQQERDLV